MLPVQRLAQISSLLDLLFSDRNLMLFIVAFPNSKNIVPNHAITLYCITELSKQLIRSAIGTYIEKINFAAFSGVEHPVVFR